MKLFCLLVCVFAFVNAKEQQVTLPVNVASQDGEFTNYITVNVGTPSQSVNLTLDLFATNSYIVDKDAKVKCDAKPVLFDYGKSSTFKLLKNNTEKYGSDYLVQDVIQLGTSTASRKFNLTDDYPTDWQCNAYSGSLGLGLDSKADSLIVDILNDYPKQELTIAPTNSKSSDLPQISLTLGGQNDDICKSDWTEAKCSATSEFTYPGCTFDVNGYSFGKYSEKRTSRIGSASLSLQRITYVPKDVYKRVLRGVTYNETLGSIPCSSPPTLSIIVNKSEYKMDGKHYLGKNLGNNNCEFLIANGYEYGLDEDLFVLPLGFFATNCQRLNYSKSSMALASAK